MPAIPAQDLTEFVSSLFEAAGVPRDESAIVATSLVESNLHGHDSHGALVVPYYLELLRKGDVRGGVSLRVVRETASFLGTDGELGFGQVQCRRLVDRVCEKAETVGLAGGTIVRCGHIGRLGEWVEQAARRGCASLISVNDNGVMVHVAPPGGLDARISTNPIGIGVPTGGEPLVLDISTSAVANGKMRVARAAHQPVPLGWLQDAEGNPTTDPFAPLATPRATLLPFGGDQSYKGFGLGLLFDILVGGLSGGYCPPAPSGTVEWNNVLFVAWNPARCGGEEHFLSQADKLIAYVRDSRRKPGVDAITLPGDRSGALREERLRDGIPLAEETCRLLSESAQELGVAAPRILAIHD